MHQRCIKHHRQLAGQVQRTNVPGNVSRLVGWRKPKCFELVGYQPAGVFADQNDRPTAVQVLHRERRVL